MYLINCRAIYLPEKKKLEKNLKMDHETQTVKIVNFLQSLNADVEDAKYYSRERRFGNKILQKVSSVYERRTLFDEQYRFQTTLRH